MGEKEKVEKAVDQIKKPGREQRVINAVHMVFKGQEECWLSIGFVNMQLCRHPRRFGLESMNEVPLPKKFERLILNCEQFDRDKMGKQVLVRPKKELWPV